MENELNIIKTQYSEIMQRSYIDYAMSVIISRALPDIRDGLKPVQRRTIYDMYELGIKSDKPYRKSARIVGDTMGKYHPHGDSSIYESLVVMSQDFKKSEPLVDGHGNFGSIEGDGAAAMRYTESRLAKISEDIFFEEIDKDTVNFVPNFDESEKEPEVLPCKISNFLVNGAEGIAVGMTTSVPTHNITEVIDATIAYIKNNNITTKGLMKYIKGPDFPTGGIVTNKEELLDIYKSGTGKIKVRGKVEIEGDPSKKQKIIISEIPYTMVGAGITKFLQDVAKLIETKQITQISDISNQSSKEGIRIVLDLKKNADAENIVNILYKKTKLEDTFSVNMLAVKDSKPETLSLKDVIESNVDFQFEINNRKYQYLLKKEEHKKEIQEGLIKAVDVIDLIIEILRGSKNIADAKKCLIEGDTSNIKFKSQSSEKMAKMLMFSEIQANAILEMRLSKLIGLEIKALKANYEESVSKIKQYNEILNSYEVMANTIISDLTELKKKYKKTRKTFIDDIEEVQIKEEEVQEEEIYFLMDKAGYAKTIDVSSYERNKESAIEESKYIFPILNVGKVCILTNTGKMHTIKASDIPLDKFRAKGIPIDNVSKFNSYEEIIRLVCDFDELRFINLLFVTKAGQVKRIEAKELIGSNKTMLATKLKDDDEVVSILKVNDFKQVILRSKNNKFLRFKIEDIPTLSKSAKGVKGMELSLDDQVLEAFVVDEENDDSIFVQGKKINLSKIKLSNRALKGTKINV